jgi:hypothetical protein
MPERWERELRKLRDVEMQEPSVRERIERGPNLDREPRPRSDRMVAGIVAAAVAISAGALLWQVIPDEESRDIGGPTDNLPTLLVTFESNGMIGGTPSDASPIRRVDTAIMYGDAREENFTSTTRTGALVDYVDVGQVTPFVPGPTVGSPVRIEADGSDPRVLIGSPDDWPEFERFTRIDALPDEAGDYVIVFEADYPEGIARTARRVRVVTPGVLQLDITEGKSLDAAMAAAYVDGRRTDGFLSTSWFMQSDVGGQSPPRAPSFGPDAWLPLRSGSPMTVASAVNEARAGLYPSYGDFDLDRRLPIDLLEGAGVIDGPDGRHLLAVEATWTHGQVGWAHDGTEERALFFFPVEIVTEEPAPTPGRSPSPNVVSPDVVTIDIRRSSEETGDPEATARLGAQEVWMCPDGWIVVNPDGTEENRIFDCGQTDVFRAPVGTPIVVSGDFASVNATARLSAAHDRTTYQPEAVPAIDPASVVFFQYEVSWDDGSTASFWLLLTVGEGAQTGGDPAEVVVWIEGLGRSEASRRWPVMTVSFGGETYRGCTEGFEWITADLSRIDEVSGRKGSILVQCSYDPLFVVPPRTPIVVVTEPDAEAFVTRTTTPLYAGTDGIGASVRWPDGDADFIAMFEVRYEEPVARNIVPDCPPADRASFAAPDGGFIMPGGSAFITGNLDGFLQHDVVEQMTKRDGGGAGGWDGTWQVVRNGSVIAAVEFPELSGVACRGSGIAGV